MVLPSHNGLFGRQVSRLDYSAQRPCQSSFILFYFISNFLRETKGKVIVHKSSRGFWTIIDWIKAHEGKQIIWHFWYSTFFYRKWQEVARPFVAALATGTGAVTERNRRYHKPTVIEMESERPEDLEVEKAEEKGKKLKRMIQNVDGYVWFCLFG